MGQGLREVHVVGHDAVHQIDQAYDVTEVELAATIDIRRPDGKRRSDAGMRVLSNRRNAATRESNGNRHLAMDMPCDQGDKLVSSDGLGCIVVAPGAETLFAVVGHRVRRQGDDRTGVAFAA